MPSGGRVSPGGSFRLQSSRSPPAAAHPPPMLTTLQELQTAQPVAHAVLVLCLVSVLGLAIGSFRFRGIGLGTAAVLFAGILFGHFGQNIDPGIQSFVREFGLILFVFTIGLQLGPGFFSSLRQQGLRLNLLAAAVALSGAATAAILGKLANFDIAAILGLFSGATTNTPSLGAAQQVLKSLPGLTADRAALPALAYAVAYPAGIAGIIGSLVLLKAIFHINPAEEAAAFQATTSQDHDPLERRTLKVENPNLDGLTLPAIPGLKETGVTLSRIQPASSNTVHPLTPTTPIHLNDLVLAVGSLKALDQFQRILGSQSDADLMAAPGDASYRRVRVTRHQALSRTLAEMALFQRFNVTVTRMVRSDVEMAAFPGLRVQFGDVLHLVGRPQDIDQAEKELGNSTRALNETQFLAIFAGIAIGVLIGVIPFLLPGLPQPVRLGLAGGPLLAAILLSRLGNLGPLVFYMPPNANLAFRELGITLFLACVGLKAGEHFLRTVLTGTGLAWLGVAILITTLPLLIIGIVARKAWNLNYLTLSGLLAGSMTDPPALAFANTLARSEAPAVAYATVYPLAMILRILSAQILALFLAT